MSQKIRRRPLKKTEKRLLCSLADPLSPAPPEEDLMYADALILFDAIDHHGIEPVALRKLKTIRTYPQGEFADCIYEAGDRQFIANAQTMALENIANNLSEQIDEAGARAVIVKGQVFATQLYPHLSDRPFTDIDILTPTDERDKVGRLLQKLGYQQAKRDLWDKSESNMEQKWVSDGNSNILIELHTNLVHYPNLRRRISFGYEQYMIASQDLKLPAAANFLVAVIHAAAGHKFHKLQLLVDVLQAFRKLEHDDICSLDKTFEKIPALLEVLVCLDLIRSLFGQEQAAELSTQFARRSKFSVIRKLVDANQVLDTYLDTYHHSRFRRHAFRFCQNRLAR